MTTTTIDTPVSLSGLAAQAVLARGMANRTRQNSQAGMAVRNPPTPEASVQMLEQVRQLLGHYLTLVMPHSATELGLTMELAECLGALGSLMRDSGKFREAISYYAAGREIEIRIRKLSGKPNSYCLVQELVAQLLQAPEALNQHGGAIRERLHAALHEVKGQIADGRDKDIWAHADLALLTQLLHPEQSILAWGEFHEFAPLQMTADSVRHVLTMLYSALQSELDPQALLSWQNTLSGFWQAAQYARAHHH